jgi:hypothetical protein
LTTIGVSIVGELSAVAAPAALEDTGRTVSGVATAGVAGVAGETGLAEMGLTASIGGAPAEGIAVTGASGTGAMRGGICPGAAGRAGAPGDASPS